MAKTILLADDSVTIRKVVELTFMDEDYEVVAVASGDEALAQLESAAPDIIIADIHMPGASGYDVARTAKEKDPGVPVLLLVGTFEQFDPADVEASGAERFLKKPFDSQELLRMVEQLLDAAPAPELEIPEMENPFSMDAPSGSTEVQPPADLDAPGSAFAELEPAESLIEAPGAAMDTQVEGVFGEPETEFGPVEIDEEIPSLLPLDEPLAGAEPEPDADTESVPVSEPEPEPLRLAEPGAPEPISMSEPEDGDPVVEQAPIEDEEPAAAAFEPEEIGELSEEDVDRIARRVVDYLSDDVVRDLAWEILPDLAEVILKARLRELEGQVE